MRFVFGFALIFVGSSLVAKDLVKPEPPMPTLNDIEALNYCGDSEDCMGTGRLSTEQLYCKSLCGDAGVIINKSEKKKFNDYRERMTKGQKKKACPVAKCAAPEAIERWFVCEHSRCFEKSKRVNPAKKKSKKAAE